VDPLFEQLRARLAQSPGRALNLPGAELREAAVLVPLFIRESTPYVLFTKRPLTLRTHAGQISFPGGGRDPEDATLLHTALRENEEELGIPRDDVTVLGMLDELPTITRYRITPFVGVIPATGAYRPNPVEIEQVLEVPLAHLLDPANHRLERRRERELSHDIHYFDYGAHVIWGATARIMKTLLLLGAELPSIQSLHERK